MMRFARSRAVEWRLHAGAHKTASTHMQLVLEAERDAIAAAGVDFIPMDTARELGLWKLMHERPRRFSRLRRWPETALEAAVAPARIGPARIAVSEELILGQIKDMIDDPVYPGAVRRLRRFVKMAGRAPVSLFLGVRSFSGVLPGAHAQSLRLRPAPGGFAAMRDRAVAAPPRWSGLVDRIRTALPDLPLTVWRFEDYVARETEVMSLFCGVPVRPRARMAPPKRTATPSAEAVARMEALPMDLDAATRRAATWRILEETPSGPKFDPLDDDARAVLDAAYEEDMARIARDHPDVPARFGEERPEAADPDQRPRTASSR